MKPGWKYLSRIYKLCLSVCLFVCLYPINVKTAELIESKFLRGNLHDPGQGRLMDDQNKKNAIKKGGTGEGTLSETKKKKVKK